MIWFILGMASGNLIGAIGMSLMQAASRAYDSMEEFYKRFDDEHQKKKKQNKTSDRYQS